MNFKQIEKLIIHDGWYLAATHGSHCQYKHHHKKGKVTIPKHGKKDIPLKTVKSILRQAGLE